MCIFDQNTLKNLIEKAISLKESILIPYYYDIEGEVISTTENGSCKSSVAAKAPIIVFNKCTLKDKFKNFRVLSESWVFLHKITHDKLLNTSITTIIRFHKGADKSLLKRALLSLLAIDGIRVNILIATQNFSSLDSIELKTLLNTIPFYFHNQYTIKNYNFDDNSDKRSVLLNKSLKSVKTRYVAFLDYDDVVRSGSYSQLVNRLESTSYVITFGYVHDTLVNGKNIIVSRDNTYISNPSYDQFLKGNIFPLHSFVICLERLDLNNIHFHEDQKFLEDYYFLLQIITTDNTDWSCFKKPINVGDYIKNLHVDNTLAIACPLKRQDVVQSIEYRKCMDRIKHLQARLNSVCVEL
jgi:hypothetical protein